MEDVEVKNELSKEELEATWLLTTTRRTASTKEQFASLATRKTIQNEILINETNCKKKKKN